MALTSNLPASTNFDKKRDRVPHGRKWLDPPTLEPPKGERAEHGWVAAVVESVAYASFKPWTLSLLFTKLC